MKIQIVNIYLFKLLAIMKAHLKLLVIIIHISISYSSFAQNVSINRDGTTPDGSAMLDVTATDAGILIPRMTEAQRNAISSPATGLLIYQTNQFPGFRYYTGSIWTPIYNSLFPYTKEVNSTDSLLCTIAYGIIPGLTDTVILSANAKVVIEVNGAMECSSNKIDEFSNIEVAIFEDGAKLSNGAHARLFAVNDKFASTTNTYENFHLKTIRTLTAGTYVFAVKAKRITTGGQSKQPIVGGDSTTPRGASMSVQVLYE